MATAIGYEATTDEVLKLSKEDRATVAAHMGLTPLETVQLELVVMRQSANKVVDPVSLFAQQLSAQEARTLEKWRHREQQLAARSRTFRKMKVDELRKKFVEQAKDAQISPTESLLLFTSLYATEEERVFMAALILCEIDNDRLPQFNYSIARSKGEQFMSQHGATLTGMPYPLFPAVEDFDALNQRLLREYGTVEGGAPTPRCPTTFRKSRGNEDVLGSGPTLAVTQNAQTGQWEADGAPIQAVFDDIFNKFRVLSAKVDAMTKETSKTPEKDKTPAEKHISSLAAAVRELRRTITAAHQSTLNRSQRARHRNPRGGEPEEGAASPRF